MAKTNKELAVELYSATLIAAGIIRSNPNFSGKVEVPTYDRMVEHVQELTDKLARIQDD